MSDAIPRAVSDELKTLIYVIDILAKQNGVKPSEMCLMLKSEDPKVMSQTWPSISLAMGFFKSKESAQ